MSIACQAAYAISLGKEPSILQIIATGTLFCLTHVFITGFACQSCIPSVMWHIQTLLRIKVLMGIYFITNAVLQNRASIFNHICVEFACVVFNFARSVLHHCIREFKGHW